MTGLLSKLSHHYYAESAHIHFLCVQRRSPPSEVINKEINWPHLRCFDDGLPTWFWLNNVVMPKRVH